MPGPEPSALPLGDSPQFWASSSIPELLLFSQDVFDFQVVVPERPEHEEVKPKPGEVEHDDVPG